MRTAGFKDIGSVVITAVIKLSLPNVPRQLPRGACALSAACDAVLSLLESMVF